MPSSSKEELLGYWEELGPNARKVLNSLAARLAMGARQYGDFQPRKWTKEAAEEALDQSVYLTAELLLAQPVDETSDDSTKRSA